MSIPHDFHDTIGLSKLYKVDNAPHCDIDASQDDHKDVLEYMYFHNEAVSPHKQLVAL
jgi:hypothetical protein